MFYPSKVTLEKYISKNAHHQTTYGTPQTPSCQYQELIQKVKDSNGEDVIATAWLLFPPSVEIDYLDKITLPDGTHQKIVSIARIKNHMGKDKNVEVYLSKKGGLT